MPHKKISFAIVGQPKSGTTALAQFLSEHPHICMSQPKEPVYFATDLIQESDKFHGKPKYFMIRTPKEYDKCFSHCRPNQMLSESTTNYLHSKTAAINLYHHNPDVKIIIMLRNPIDFIHSLHMQYVNTTAETEQNFEKAVKLEPKRQHGKNIPSRVRCPSLLYYTQRGMYYDQVKRYFDVFNAKNILAITNEEFRENNHDTYIKILRFLNLDTNFLPSFKTVKASQSPRLKNLNKLLRSAWLNNSLHKLLPSNTYKALSETTHKIILKKQPRTTIDPKLRIELETLFYEDVKKTGSILGRNLAREWSFKNEYKN